MRLHLFFFTVALMATFLLAGCSSEPETPTTNNAPPSASAKPEASVERSLQVLPDSAFKAQLSVINPPATLAPGAVADLSVRVKNTSDTAWPMRGRAGDGFYQINLGDRWIDSANQDVKVDERVFLPSAVKPGEEVDIPFVMVAPAKAGDYTVEVDMVQEGVAWFAHKGSTPTRIKIKVQ